LEIGATADTDATSRRIAATSSCLNGTAVACPGPICCPGITINTLLPRLAMFSVTLSGRAGAERHHDNDGVHPNHDAEDGQRRSERIAPDRSQR
jgi:hypothetical protein